MEKIINLLINNWTKGVDTYTHNGSTWLIFSESKQWVIELTESKTLWYNYNFFKELFSLTSMDVVDNQHYITKWVEDNLINVPKCTEPVEHTRNAMTKDTIKYGVKDTILEKNITEGEVDDIIQDGVKETFNFDEKHALSYEQGVKKLVEDVIQDGVKETNWFEGPMLSVVDNVIDDGINHTEIGWHQCNNVDDVIEKGVIETKGDASQNPMGKVTKVIKNGINKSIAAGYERPNSLVYVKWPDEIDEVLENGVKETHSVSKNLFWQIGDTIQNGVKETSLKRGTRPFMVKDTIQNGVKETKTPSNGDIVSFAEWMKENNSTSYPKLIDDVIENGVKETFDTEFMPKAIVEDIILNGVKETKVCHYTDPKTNIIHVRWPDKIVDVIQNGTKNPSV